MSLAPLAIATGDPAGIGPSVAARACARLAGSAGPFLLFGDATALSRELVALGVAPPPVLGADNRLEAGEPIALAHVARWSPDVVLARAPTAEGGKAQLAALEAAARAVREGRARGLVTGPTSKAAIELAGVPFTGQTEHLAAMAGLPRDAVTMMFLGPRLRVALVTTHLAVADVPAAVTSARVARTVRHLAEALLRLGTPTPARLVVVGLNPHAGEGGLFGDEEQTRVAPALEVLAAEPPFADGRVRLVGPRPAEAALREAASGRHDGVVCMMHDQATIASKLLDWGDAVNVTWGLPFVRTSVDHGVAYDAAAAGEGDDAGMRAAIVLADRLTRATS